MAEVLHRPGAIVVRPICQLPSGEVAEGPDHRRACIVAVAVPARRIVAVHADGCAGEAPCDLWWAPRLQPSVEQLRHMRILLCGRSHTETSGAQANEPESVAMHPLDAIRQHILARLILLEGPSLQHRQDFQIRNPAVFSRYSL